MPAQYRSSFDTDFMYRGGEWTVQDYDRMALQAEADLFLDWYAPFFKHDINESVKEEWTGAWSKAFENLSAHAPGLALRDFHAENIFYLPKREGTAQVGLIDFQDALFAHPSYDLVSLIEDARRDVEPALAPVLTQRFCEEAGIVYDDKFKAAYAVQAAQRNAKILGIFVRLAKRDGKEKYLDLIPRVAAHLANDLSHTAMKDIRLWVETYTPSVLNQ